MANAPARHHTFVISDVHLADAEPEDPKKPLWRRYKLAQHFPDLALARFLEHAEALAGGAPIELVLNGDIFDFDVILATPSRAEAAALGFKVTFLERRRGLGSEEAKSLWKFRRILAAHQGLMGDLRAFVMRGHRIVLVIGNHDMEMHWPSVQRLFLDGLGLPPEDADRAHVTPWFYRSGDDTLVTHGNQLDPYCLCQDPLHPFAEVRGRRRVRLPFGAYTGKFLSNGIGWFNPHVADTFVKSVREWVSFFYRVIARHQPFIVFTWLWSAIAALLVTLRDGFLPPVRDPTTLEQRLEAAARASNASAGMALAVRAVDVHPAVFRPWKVMRELWLDRAFLLLLIGAGSFQAIASLNLLVGVSPWWIGAVLAILLVPFVFYARSIDSDVSEVQALIHARVPILAEITRTRRVIMGHTHGALFEVIEGVPYINTGHWAPGFHDLECTVPHGVRGFAWVRPGTDGARVAELRSFDGEGSSVLGSDRPTPTYSIDARVPDSDSDRGPLAEASPTTPASAAADSGGPT